MPNREHEIVEKSCCNDEYKKYDIFKTHIRVSTVLGAVASTVFFPLLCILAIMSVAPGLADLLHLFNRYAANYSLCRALASAPGDFGHSHAGAMALAEPINFPS